MKRNEMDLVPRNLVKLRGAYASVFSGHAEPASAVPTNSREFEAQDARQGEIILRTKTRWVIFIAGLVGFVILVVLLQFASIGRQSHVGFDLNGDGAMVS